MSNLIDLTEKRQEIEDNKPVFLFSALAMCLDCKKRWVAGVPAETSLFMLECPECHEQNSFASILPSEYLGEFL
jgi:hypothetical protein